MYLTGINVFISSLFLLSTGFNAIETQKRILVQDNYYEIISRLDKLTKKVESLDSLNHNNAVTINNFTKKVEVLSTKVTALQGDVGKVKHQPVLFVAYLTKSITGHNHQIIFDDVKINVGNGYKVTHGNFIAPVNGTYQFTIYLCSNSGHYVVLELTINTIVVERILAGDPIWVDCNTGVYFHRLTVGDDVYVQHEKVGDYLFSSDSHGFSMFTGLLINTE